MSGDEKEKEFWVKLGMDIGETRQCSQNTKEELHQFINNDYRHTNEKIDLIEKKVDKVATKVAVIMGAVGLIWILIQIVLKVIPLLKVQ